MFLIPLAFMLTALMVPDAHAKPCGWPPPGLDYLKEKKMMRNVPLIIMLCLALAPVAAIAPAAPDNLMIEAEKGALSGGAKVMTDHRGYSGQGFVAGFEGLGASASVSVGVPASGSARLSIRYSAGWGFQTVGLYVDGQKAADLRLAGTNGWDDWATATVDVQLSAGMRTVEVRRDRGDSGTINIDWFNFVLAKGTPTASVFGGSSGHVVCEAEDGIVGGGAKIASDHSDFSGKGFVAGFESAGASVRLPITILASVPVMVSIRYSAGWGDQIVQLYLDGRKVADLRMMGTQGWDAWKMLDLEVPIPAGIRELEIRRDSRDTGVINIDKVTLSAGAAPTQPTVPPATPPTSGDPMRQPSALAAAVSVEAELCALSGSAKIDADHSGYTGLGFVAGFGDMGAAIRFTLPARQAGPATIELRYSAGFGDETVGLYVDGGKAADLRCARTAGWDSWASAAATLPLGQGTHIVEIRRDRPDTGLINVDSIACR